MIFDTEEELYAKFDRAAFYDSAGQGRFKPPVEPCDLAIVLITRHNGYAHEWFKDFVGVKVLAKMNFHKSMPTSEHKYSYMYSVTPIKINENGVYVAHDIKSDCIEIQSFVELD